MKRALIVVLIALLIASVSGINSSSLALEAQAGTAGDAHAQDMASRAQKIGVGQVIKIERTDGSESNAVLEEVLPNAITVLILEGQDRRRETIPFAEIENLSEVRGHKLRNILIGVGVGVAVLVGACAVALNDDDAAP